MTGTVQPPLRLGMIGCGLISHAHGRVAAKSRKAITFAACASRNRERVDGWAEIYGCQNAYTDFREMIANEQLDGVVITTWPLDHREHIEACLDAGVRNILCEKPLVANAREAFDVWQLSRNAGAFIMEGFMYRHHSAMTAFRDELADSALGAIDSIYASFHMFDPEDTEPGDSTRSWRQKEEAGGGVPLDFLCYPVDAVNSLAGALPVKAVAFGSRSEKFGTINRLYGHIHYENGVVATVESSRRADFSQRLQVSCAHGELSLPVAWSIIGDATITRRHCDSFLHQDVDNRVVPLDEPHDGRLVDFPVFRHQLENFAAVIRSEAEPRTRLEESVVNACVTDALLESFEGGRVAEVRIPAPIRSSWAACPGNGA